MKENENEKRETLADILAEMSDFSDKRIEEGRDHAMTSESVGLVVHQLAKRFEAAWTREREELDKRISDLEAYAKLWTGRADELRLKCDEFYAKAKPVGNAAAMREALEWLLGFGYSTTDGGFHMPDAKMARNKIEAALSAPARNCDVGTAEEHAQRFYNFCESNSSGINGMCKPTCPCIDCFDKCQCFAKWAQMPYEAQEGGAK